MINQERLWSWNNGAERPMFLWIIAHISTGTCVWLFSVRGQWYVQWCVLASRSHQEEGITRPAGIQWLVCVSAKLPSTVMWCKNGRFWGRIERDDALLCYSYDYVIRDVDVAHIVGTGIHSSWKSVLHCRGRSWSTVALHSSLRTPVWQSTALHCLLCSAFSSEAVTV